MTCHFVTFWDAVTLRQVIASHVIGRHIKTNNNPETTPLLTLLAVVYKMLTITTCTFKRNKQFRVTQAGQLGIPSLVLSLSLSRWHTNDNALIFLLLWCQAFITHTHTLIHRGVSQSSSNHHTTKKQKRKVTKTHRQQSVGVINTINDRNFFYIIAKCAQPAHAFAVKHRSNNLFFNIWCGTTRVNIKRHAVYINWH